MQTLFSTRWAMGLLALGLLSCGGGGGGPSGPSNPTPPPAADTPTVTITAAGVSPKELRVPVGSQVRFVNQDGSMHEMQSDPHLVHTDCPAVNAVGVLRPGESRMTARLDVVRACNYHDHTQDANVAFRGAVLVGDATNPDPRY